MGNGDGWGQDEVKKARDVKCREMKSRISFISVIQLTIKMPSYFSCDIARNISRKLFVAIAKTPTYNMTPVVNLYQVLQITQVVTGCTFIARAEPAPNDRKNGHVEEMTRASLHQTQHVQCLQSTCIAFTEPLCNTILISEFVHFHNRAVVSQD